MKRLVFIPLLFVSYMGMAQVADSASIIGKSIRIGNLLVSQHDFPTQMNWDDAKAACAALGPGWRLPSIEEWDILYQNKDNIGGFVAVNYDYYWSSTEETIATIAYIFYLTGDTADVNNKASKCNVRAVRDF